MARRAQKVALSGAMATFAVLTVHLATSSGAGVAAVDKTGDKTNAPDYEGRLHGERGARIELRLERDPSGQRQVVVDARGIRDLCENGTRRTTLGVRTSDGIDRDGRFEALLSSDGDSTHNLEYLLARGRILEGGRARGILFSYFDPTDPPGAGPNRDECWTDGIVRWSAGRTTDQHPNPVRSTTQPKRLTKGSPGPVTAARRAVDRYTGQLSGISTQPNALTLEVTGPMNRRQVSFHADLPVSCEGEPRAESVTLAARVRRDGRFEKAVFSQRRQPRGRFFSRVVGRLRASGRADGVFTYIDDPWDPASGPNEPECTVAPFEFWKARKAE